MRPKTIISEKAKVILDTNSINNCGISNGLFGNKKELEELSGCAQLFIPKIVLEEIKEHKRSKTQETINSITKNGLYKVLNIEKGFVNKIDVNFEIEKDCVSEKIPYEVIDIESPKLFLEKFIPLSIKNKAPFNKESDKGFKDALIAGSIEYLLDSIPCDESIILVTNDGRLKEYFQDNNRVVSVGCLKDAREKIDMHKVIDTPYSVIVPKTRNERKIDNMLSNFRNSASFYRTHEIVREITPYMDKLSPANKADLIRSALNNNQIRWVSQDDDIKNFLIDAYEGSKEMLSYDEIKDLGIIINNPNIGFDILPPF